MSAKTILAVALGLIGGVFGHELATTETAFADALRYTDVPRTVPNPPAVDFLGWSESDLAGLLDARSAPASKPAYGGAG